jgi:hypothetical protein
MQQIYDEIKRLQIRVIISPKTIKKADCPSVFRKGNDWYMTYILFDGRGYETLL